MQDLWRKHGYRALEEVAQTDTSLFVKMAQQSLPQTRESQKKLEEDNAGHEELLEKIKMSYKERTERMLQNETVRCPHCGHLVLPT